MTDESDNAGIIAHPPVFYIIAVLIGLGGDYLIPLSFGLAAGTKIAGFAVFVTGTVISVMSFKMFAGDKQSPSVHEPTNSIYTSGVYSLTRNPIYLGVLMWVVAASFYFDKLWLLIICVPLVVFLNKAVIEKEEAYLENKFGDEYRDYKSKVRRWI